MKYTFFCSIISCICLLTCCSENESLTQNPITVSFRSSDINVPEDQTASSILLEFEEPASFNGVLDILITEYNATQPENFVTQPGSEENSISLSFEEGATQASLVIAPQIDADNETDSLKLSIINTDLILSAGHESVAVFITENSPSVPDSVSSENGLCSDQPYSTGTVTCSTGYTSESLDVVTWNIENFPMTSNSTAEVIEIIKSLNADIYAIQEIDEIIAFNTVVSSLAGYEGVSVDVRGGIELGYIYKTSEIVSISSPKLLFEGQTSPFPREPAEVDITHSNGLEVKLINFHLKCCDDGIERRADASDILKTYLDEAFVNEKVIVLGDWNEDLVNGSDAFDNFLTDNANYTFVDLPINEGASTNFSYPSWPSHLDHILITNELCDHIISCYSALLDDCNTNYFADVSDHRPVIASFKAN